MNDKKLRDITQELRELYPNLEKESEEKVLKVFQNLQDIQKKSLPNAAFKKTLKEKLETLHTLGDQSILSELQSNRFSLSLLSGLFASFVFIAGFLYVMQGVLFQNPVTNQALQLNTLTGEQSETTISIESLSENSSDTILKADDVLFNGITNPYKTSPSTVTSTSESSADTSGQNGGESTSLDTTQSNKVRIQDTSPQSDDVNTSSSTKMMEKTPTPPTEDSPQATDAPEQGALFMELMMSDAPAENQEDSFQEFCSGQGGRFDTNTRICTKGQNTCNETQYNSSSCNLDASQKEDTQTDIPEQKSTQGGL